MRSEKTTDDKQYIPARLAYARYKEGKLRDLLAMFLDNQEHSVEEALALIEQGEKARPGRDFNKKLRKFSVYMHRINKLVLSDTLRFIGRTEPGKYRLLHAKR